MRLRGREKEHFDFAINMLEKVKAELSDIGKVYQDVKREGNSVNMLLVPIPENQRVVTKKPAKPAVSMVQNQPTTNSAPQNTAAPKAEPEANQNKEGDVKNA